MRGKWNGLVLAFCGILIATLLSAGFPRAASANQDVVSPTSAPTYGAWPARACFRAFYIVHPGDNLFRIGLRFHVNYLAIAQFNRLRNPNLIFFGMPLLIPCANAYAPNPSPYSPAYPPNRSPYSPMNPPAQPPRMVAPSPGGQSNVTIMDFQFAPATLNIRMGQTVVWRNNGPSLHTTTSDSGLWSSATLSTGQTFSHTFAAAGTFTYHCAIHPFMHGTIVVTP